MENQTTCRTGSCWNPWPLIRLLSAVAVIGLWLHWRFDCRLPTLRECGSTGLALFEVMSLCALFSFALAHVFLVVLNFPFYAIVVLNDWFYEGSRWVFRLLMGPSSPRLTAGLSLAGELGLFLGTCRLIEFLLKRYCL
ncbi:MAG: hypothetical protein WCU88_08930 [Elusimicrobiota bacterium]|jgi:hypothetical protein